MKSRTSFVLGLAASSAWGGVHAFLQPFWRLPGSPQAGIILESSTPSVVRQFGEGPLGGGRRQQQRGEELQAAADPTADPTADPSSVPRKKGKRRKTTVKQAVELWSTESLELHRFNQKRVHVCNAKTLPEVLSEFWSLAGACAQAKYSAMADDRDYVAHVLFVVAKCDLLKDYGMMRHLDKVLDFSSGGCADFGRTVTLQHYHPDFVLPPSHHAAEEGDDADGRSGDKGLKAQLARMVHFSRSPYPAFGLTVAGGSAVRQDPLQTGDKIGRLRLDLEMVYNSVAGCSTDDSVDAHGSEHGSIPSSPDVVKEKTDRWLSACFSAADVETGPGRFLSGAGEFVTTGLSTPEEVLSQIWSIVAQLQEKALPILAAERVEDPAPTTATTPTTAPEATAGAAGGGVGVAAETGKAKRVAAGDEEGAEKEEEEEAPRDPLMSTLLVAPRLHPFNAAQFDNFARSLAIALKQTPIMDRIEVEVYHPEFVCEGGIIDPVRRSPFPTLLIKHCGLKDELFEPSGMYRHAVPPLKLPMEGVDVSEQDSSPDSSDQDTASEVSSDDAQL